MPGHRKPIDKLMDCHTTKRWTLCNTTLESNVASHSFNVAMIAMAISKSMYTVIGHSERDVCYFALMHDVDEAETGDVPTPTKEEAAKAGVDLNRLHFTQGMTLEPPSQIRDIIKMADLVENYLFISEYGRGPRARAAEQDALGRVIRATNEASSKDLSRATLEVMHYIRTRKSDTYEERKRIEEDSKRLRETAEFARDSVARFMAGKSRDGTGNS